MEIKTFQYFICNYYFLIETISPLQGSDYHMYYLLFLTKFTLCPHTVCCQTNHTRQRLVCLNSKIIFLV